MSERNQVWIERVDGNIARIFSSTHSEAFNKALLEGRAFTYPRKDAVGTIWETLWTRANGHCELCGAGIARTGYRKGEMHEMLPRGKRGEDGQRGEISIWNSKMVCRKCHGQAHHDRRPRWSSENELPGLDKQ